MGMIFLIHQKVLNRSLLPLIKNLTTLNSTYVLLELNNPYYEDLVSVCQPCDRRDSAANVPVQHVSAAAALRRWVALVHRANVPHHPPHRVPDRALGAPAHTEQFLTLVINVLKYLTFLLYNRNHERTLVGRTSICKGAVNLPVKLQS